MRPIDNSPAMYLPACIHTLKRQDKILLTFFFFYSFRSVFIFLYNTKRDVASSCGDERINYHRARSSDHDIILSARACAHNGRFIISRVLGARHRARTRKWLFEPRATIKGCAARKIRPIRNMDNFKWPEIIERLVYIYIYHIESTLACDKIRI